MTAITTDLTSGYTPPGVYIAESSNPISIATGMPPGRLTLLGRGQGAQTATEQIPLTEEGVTLSQKGIDADSIVITTVSGDVAVDETQFLAETDPVAPEGQDYLTRISRVTEAATPEGTQVWVTYAFVPVGYDQSRIFTSLADIQAMYGPSFASGNASQVNSPLTLASEIAFANGVSEIQIVPLESVSASSGSPAILAALTAAYDKISGDYSANVVVPLTDGLDATDTPSAAIALRAHIATASAAGYYRVGIFGAPLTYTSAPTAIINGGLKSSRTILAYASPEGMVFRDNASGERVTLGHQYLAAAYGGRMASEPVQQSLTRRVVSGFADVATTVSHTDKNTYAAAGVALTERDRAGRLIIRHGTSTNRSDLASSEPSVTRARDVMVTLIQTGLDSSDLIGSPMDDNTPLSVKSIVAGVLEYCDTNNVIVAYDDLQVRIQSLNPSVIEVKFRYRPSFPLNYILVNFAIDLNTGQTENLDDLTGVGV